MSDPDTVTNATVNDRDDGTAWRRMFRPRDPALAALALLILAILVWREFRLADESEQKQEARSTAVGLAAQVQAECDDPEVGVALAICRQAEEIVEDPENPPAPPMPEPGEPGKPGADAPPLSDAQVARVLQPLVQPAVNEWFRSNPPDTDTAGMSRDEIAALIAELVPTADDVAALIPVPDDGAPGAPGVPGPACPNGVRPEVVDIPSAGLFLLCPA